MEVSLRFLADIPLWRDEKPYELFVSDAGTGMPKSNSQYSDHASIRMHDIRPVRHDFSIDRQGVEFAQHGFTLQPSAADFEDPDKVPTVVIPCFAETREFLQAHLGAEKAVCIDWRRKVDNA
ncbi:hypothetical protein C8A00DRAFT_34364 [Chaetomidium leptoderma]|uniref:Uncharacterized protein n=1 Tax=Chaetomidium leptoderma TaxID=669021 RepID=A0AAN6VKF6_9PEZI|nr:hypothetical protein C8A00DRAFT_34364 [Chaetomidium leptoderma]